MGLEDIALMSITEQGRALENLGFKVGVTRIIGEHDESLRRRILAACDNSIPKYPGFTATINIDQPERGSFEWGELPF